MFESRTCSGYAWLRIAAVAVVLSLLVFRPSHVNSQAPGPLPATGVISGQVIESETRTGLPGALVILQVLDGDEWVRYSAATTSPGGAYRFDNLDPDRYRLSVTRLGYVSANVEIDLRSAASSRLSVGLEIDPITLSPLAVLGGRPETFGRLRGDDADSESAALIDRVRQQRYLVSDTRELTYNEVVAAVTLAEADLFRALQRVPGVSTRDDYTATMWTRGATWDQTRIYFDGLPLYNPTHAGWLFAAVNPDAVASASFHPGYRSARWGEGAAGILDLRSRTGRSGEGFSGNAEVSVAGARMSLDGEVPDLGLNWMVAGRRSYVDLATAAFEGIGGTDDLYIPYDFTDIVGRADLQLGWGWNLATSGILEYDNLRGDIPGLLEGNRGRWGNRSGKLALEGPVGPVRAIISGGMTDFGTLVYETGDEISDPDVTVRAFENGINHRKLSVELGPRSGGGDWAAGIEMMHDRVSYEGEFSLLGALIIDSPADTIFFDQQYEGTLSHTAAWAEKRWEVGSVIDLITGLRAEFGDSVANGGSLRLGPRVAARLEPVPGTALSIGWARSFQYTQDVSPAAGPIGPQLHLSAIWILASPAPVFPALQTDITTLGFEQSFGGGYALTANAYRRQSSGLRIPNPAPGPLVVARSPDTGASDDAHGMEISLRRISGRWTGSLGYSWGNSSLTSLPIPGNDNSYEFPSSAEVVHSLDATALYRLNGKIRMGGALTYGSGVPFTRLILGGDEDTPGVPILQDPNAERTPSYASVDLMAEYDHAFTDWTLGGYVQLRNVLNRDNAVTYSGSANCTFLDPVLTGFQEACEGKTGIVDRFEPGLPLLPLIGVRISF